MSNKSRRLIFLGITIILLTLLIIPLPILAVHRYILFSIIPFFILSNGILLGNASVPLYRSDLFWVSFCVVGISSYLWTVNVSLIWFPLAIWFCLILWLLSMRVITVMFDEARLFVSYVFVGLFLISLIYIAIILLLKLSPAKYFGYNTNYLTLHLLSLWPFLLFYKKKYAFLNISCFLLLIYIFYLSHSKGSFLIFVFLIFLSISEYLYKRSKKILRYLVIAILSIGLVVFFFPGFNLFIDRIQEKIIDNGDFSRLFMLRDSFDIFKNHPLLGIGLGNWHSFAYTGDQSLFLGIQNAFYRFNSHNLYSLILAELGLIGIISYLGGVYYPIYKKIKHYKELVFLDKEYMLSISIYLLGTIFYLSSYSYESFFSGVQLIAFCSLGFLIDKNRNKSFLTINTKWLLLFSIFPLVWFLHYFKVDNIYKIAIDENTSISRSNQLLESIYHSKFKTTHGYYHDGSNLSLDLKLAINSLKMDSVDRANTFFERGLSILPNDDYLLLAYSKFLAGYVRDFRKAQDYLQVIYTKQQDRRDVNCLLAYCAIQEKQYKLAKSYMNEKYMDRRREIMPLLELQLYTESYADSLFKWTPEQKELFQEQIIDIRGEISDLYNRSFHINASKKELKDINVKLISYSNVLDIELMHILNKEQFFIYLNDISSGLVGGRLWLINYVCHLTQEQFVSIENIMKEQFVLQKYIQLKITLPSTTLLEKKQYQIELEEIATYLDSRLKSILTNTQYITYIKYNPNKSLMRSIN